MCNSMETFTYCCGVGVAGGIVLAVAVFSVALIDVVPIFFCLVLALLVQ